MTSRWIRRVAITLGAAVLLLVLAAALLLATFDADRFKTLAIDWMKTERQRTLAIDGPIELSLFPRVAVEVSKLRLSERGRNEEFAAIDEASLAVQALPLLRKQLVIDRVSARGVRALYSRDAKGVRNIDDLLGSPAAAAPGGAASTPAGGGAGVRFDVRAIKLEDLRLRVRDVMLPLEADIVLQSLTSGRIGDGARTPLALRASAQITQPQALKVALEGSASATIDLDSASVTLSDMKLAATIDGDAVKGLALDATGALAWVGSTLRAGPLRLDVKTGRRGTLVLGASSLEVKQLLFSTAGQKLELETLRVALAGRQGAEQAFEGALDWPLLAVDARTLKGSALTGQFKLSGPTAMVGKFQSGAPSGTFDALRLPAVALTLQGQMQQRKIDGRLSADVVLQAGKGAVAIDALDLKASLAEPGLQPLQLAMRGQAQADAKAAAWKFDGSLNTNRFNSNGQATLGGRVPNLQAKAHFDSLDLNKLLPPGKPGAAAAASGPAAADTPLALDGLNAVDGRFNISAAAFAFRQYKVSDVSIDATLGGGTLRVARLAGRAWGGAIEASGSAAARDQRVTVKLAADNVNVRALLKDVADKDLLEGTGRVVADVSAAGATVGALRSNLAGSAALQLRDGAIKGVNLARSLRQAQAALGGKQDAVSRADTTAKTDFSEMNASARIAGGVATSDDLDLKSPFLRIGGSGRFDVGRGHVDYTARVTVVRTAAGQEGAELAALKGVTVPVQLSGPFEAIDWKIRWSQVAAAAIENKLKDELRERLGARLGLPAASAAGASAPAQSAKDKLRDRLRGLVK